MGDLKVKVWGVRSSIPAPLTGSEYRTRLREAFQHAKTVWDQNPGQDPEEIFSDLPERVRSLVGGETSCIEIRDGDDQLVIDMGTGARRLGYDMMNRGAKGDIHILLTGTRWESIQGWPFFIPGFLPTNRVLFYTVYPNCRERFIRQQHFDHFPVEFENMLSKREFEHCPAGTSRKILSFEVTPIELDEGATAYRVEKDGEAILVCPPLLGEKVDVDAVIKRHADSFSGANVLVMAYQNAESGESGQAMRDAARCAAEWKIGKLVLIHHNPAHTDLGLRELFTEARTAVNGSGPEIALAVEGEEYPV